MKNLIYFIRDNPCPHLGNIVTIKLSENQENVPQTDNTYLTMIVETHFQVTSVMVLVVFVTCCLQMNYNTGEWKRIKKYRRLEEDTVGTIACWCTVQGAGGGYCWYYGRLVYIKGGWRRTLLTL